MRPINKRLSEEIEFRGVLNSCERLDRKLVLTIRNAAQIVSVLLQFGIEGYDTPVGVFQFLIEIGELVLFFFEFRQRLEQFLILSLDFVERINGIASGKLRRDGLDETKSPQER